MKILDQSEREDYDSTAGQFRNLELHTDWLDKLFKKYNVKTILSLGCGTGSYELLLAKKGYIILGMDYNPHMIKQANKKIINTKLKIRFVEGDIRKFNYGKFDAVISMWAPIMFGCQTIEQVESALKCIKHSMNKNSIAFFETPTPNLMRCFDKIAFWEHSDKDCKKGTMTFYNCDKKNNKVDLYYLEGKLDNKFSSEITKTKYNLYTKEQFEKLFDKLNLKVIKLFGEFNHKKGIYPKYTADSNMITPLFKCG